jgi:hypothetical protein
VIFNRILIKFNVTWKACPSRIGILLEPCHEIKNKPFFPLLYEYTIGLRYFGMGFSNEKEGIVKVWRKTSQRKVK